MRTPNTNSPVEVRRAIQRLGVNSDTVGSQVVTINAAITTLNGKVTAIESSVTTIGGRVGTLETTTTTLVSQVSTLEAGVSSLGSRVGTLETTATSLDSRVDTLETDVSAIDGRIDSLESGGGTGAISGLTAGCVPYAKSATSLSCDSDFTFANDILGVANINFPDGAGVSQGIIYKGGVRFLHNRRAASEESNTFLGCYAGPLTPSYYSASLYDGNTGVGYYSLSSLTTGYGNVALGDRSTEKGTTARANTAVGQHSLASCTTGSYNACLGNIALNSLTDGSYNTAVGRRAGAYATGSSCVFVGHYAGAYQTSDGVFVVDAFSRGSASAEQTSSLLIGLMSATVSAQTLRINGRVGVYLEPSAWLTLPAGTADVGYAPLRFTSGVLNASPAVGCVEFVTNKLYFTITTGAARKEIALSEGLTSGRVPFVTTNGRLTDSAGLLFSVDTLTVAKVSSPSGSDLTLTPASGKNVVLGTVKFPNTIGVSGQLLATNGDSTLSWVDSTVPTTQTQQNILINGGFNFFQRTDPATATARSDDTYGPDRWIVLTQTAAAQISRVAGASYSRYASRLTQGQATAQRVGLAQIVESDNSICYRGRTVEFQARVKCSASQTIRVAILEWTGTADSVTSDVVNDWTSGTYTAGNFFLASNLTVTAVGSVTPSANTWESVSVYGTVGTGCNNLIVLVWTEAAAAQNLTLDIAEAGLHPGTAVQTWQPRSIAQELALCQRYYEKSYDLDTPPTTATINGCVYSDVVSTYRIAYSVLSYKTTKRATGYAVLYSSYDGAIGYLAEYSPGPVYVANRSASVNGIGQSLTQLSGNAGDFTLGNYMRFHWSIDVEL